MRVIERRVRKHPCCIGLRTRGSDGKLGNEVIEIKTISPEKSKIRVSVKPAGNFSKLLIVRSSVDFEFQACLIDRKALKKG